MKEPYYTYPTTETPEPPARKGLGIAAIIPVLGMITFLIGPLAVILGIVAIVKHRGEGQGIAGVVTGAIGTVITIIGLLIVGILFGSTEDEVQQLREEVESADPEDEEEAAELEEDVQEQEEEVAEEREEPEESGVEGGEGTRWPQE